MTTDTESLDVTLAIDWVRDRAPLSVLFVHQPHWSIDDLKTFRSGVEESVQQIFATHAVGVVEDVGSYYRDQPAMEKALILNVEKNR